MNLLFRENSTKEVVTLRPETVKDLALPELWESIGDSEKTRGILKNLFTKLPKEPEDSAFRQEILRDFMENEDLTVTLEEALGQILVLKDYGKSKPLLLQNDQLLYSLLERLRELSTYVNVTEMIHAALQKNNPRSTGLKSLQEHLAKVVGDEKFGEAKQDIDKMLEDLSTVKGALIGVNFTPDLNVESVAAIEFVPYRLRSKYTFAEMAAAIGSIVNFAQASNSLRMPQYNMRVVDPLLVNMTPQMEKHLKRHFGEIKNCMSKYLKLDAGFITELYEGLTFYTQMAKFAKRLQDGGYEICFPELSGKEERTFTLRDFYNLRLVLSKEENIIRNDFSFSPEENLFILTGPNRGGKTIMEQALGIISVMASIGSFVTASACSGKPFANILTHFPIDENLTINYGRLGEEAVRIREIIEEADDETLVLFNETYSTTSAVDGLYLSKDLLHVMKDIGAAVIFNTHIHEVARAIPEMNEWPGGSRFVSLVMEIKDGVNTFRIRRCDPDSKSYAMNIAKKYGITYDQIRALYDTREGKKKESAE